MTAGQRISGTPPRPLHYAAMPAIRPVKDQLHDLVLEAIAALARPARLPAAIAPAFVVERAKNREHGDFATQRRVAAGQGGRAQTARTGRGAGRRAAGDATQIAKVEIAGPGFINFFLSPAAYHAEVRQRARRRRRVTAGAIGGAAAHEPASNSSRPIRPDRCTSATAAPRRSATASRACSTRTAGTSSREFYYNDAGAQIDNLALSVQARCTRHRAGRRRLARRRLSRRLHQRCRARVPRRRERARRRQSRSRAQATRTISMRSASFAVAWLRHEQDEDLRAFGVALRRVLPRIVAVRDGKVEKTVRELVAHGHTYEKDGALWLNTTDFGDDKDRVMRKSDGTLHLLPAGRRLPPDQVAARLPARDHRARRRSPRLADARAGRPAGARHGHSEGLAGIRAAPDGHGDARRRGSEDSPSAPAATSPCAI